MRWPTRVASESFYPCHAPCASQASTLHAPAQIFQKAACSPPSSSRSAQTRLQTPVQDGFTSTSSSTRQHQLQHQPSWSKPTAPAPAPRRLSLVPHCWHRCAWRHGAVRYQSGARASARLGHREAHHGGRWGAVLARERCAFACVRCLLRWPTARYRCVTTCSHHTPSYISSWTMTRCALSCTFSNAC